MPTDEELAYGEYKRYVDTENGISPMSWPGIKGGEYQTNGLEHTEDGRPTSMHLVHEKMNKKRYRKLRHVRNRYCFHRQYGSGKGGCRHPLLGFLEGAGQGSRSQRR